MHNCAEGYGETNDEVAEADAIREVIEQRAQERKKHKENGDKENFPYGQESDKGQSREEIN